MVVLWWCFLWCGGVFCGDPTTVENCGKMDVVVFLWWCSRGGVFVVVWWCFCGGVFVVVLWRCGRFFCGGVFVVLWWCFRGGVFKDCHQRLPKVPLK